MCLCHCCFQCGPTAPGGEGLIQAPREQAADGYNGHIVWFYHVNRHLYDYDHLEIRALPGVETVADLTDGVVFRVTPECFDMDGYLAKKNALITSLLTAAGEPIIRSIFDVYLHDKALLYVKERCSQDDRDAIFSLHWAPTDKVHLPAYWKEYGFNVRDFRFKEYEVRGSDKCMAVIELPEYDISRIKTGQFVYGKEKELVWRWRDSFRLDE